MPHSREPYDEVDLLPLSPEYMPYTGVLTGSRGLPPLPPAGSFSVDLYDGRGNYRFSQWPLSPAEALKWASIESALPERTRWKAVVRLKDAPTRTPDRLVFRRGRQKKR